MTQAEKLAEMLQQQGWSVFWDLTIPPGKTWHQVIDSELTQAQSLPPGSAGVSPAEMAAKMVALPGKGRGGVNAYLLRCAVA